MACDVQGYLNKSVTFQMKRVFQGNAGTDGPPGRDGSVGVKVSAALTNKSTPLTDDQETLHNALESSTQL